MGDAERPTVPTAVQEPPERANVSRAQLWRIVDAARAFLLATNGRWDAGKFELAKEELVREMDVLPKKAFTPLPPKWR